MIINGISDRIIILKSSLRLINNIFDNRYLFERIQKNKMTRQSIYAAATLIIVGTASALSYNNATIKFDPNLDCTSCIRGGYDYCLYSNAS